MNFSFIVPVRTAGVSLRPATGTCHSGSCPVGVGALPPKLAPRRAKLRKPPNPQKIQPPKPRHSTAAGAARYRSTLPQNATAERYRRLNFLVLIWNVLPIRKCDQNIIFKKLLVKKGLVNLTPPMCTTSWNKRQAIILLPRAPHQGCRKHLSPTCKKQPSQGPKALLKSVTYIFKRKKKKVKGKTSLSHRCFHVKPAGNSEGGKKKMPPHFHMSWGQDDPKLLQPLLRPSDCDYRNIGSFPSWTSQGGHASLRQPGPRSDGTEVSRDADQLLTVCHRYGGGRWGLGTHLPIHLSQKRSMWWGPARGVSDMTQSAKLRHWI